MTKSQKLQVEQSEKRQRINALLSQAEMSDPERAELDTLTRRMGEIEGELRAAIVAEAAEVEQRRGEFGEGSNGSGEGAEIRALVGERGQPGRARLANYCAAVLGGVDLAGAEAELNSALEVRARMSAHTPIPWEVFDSPDLRDSPELRADAASTTSLLDGGTMQRPILQRLFGRDINAALGVRFDSVPSGMSEWPLLTGGVSPAQVAEDAALADAAAPSFNTQSLKPKRLSGRYVFTYEQAAQVQALEQALRRDIADAVKDQICRGVVSGTGTGNNQVNGILTTLTAPTDPGGVATWADYAGLPALGVDGIHAARESEVTTILGIESFQFGAKIYRDDANEAGTDAIMRRGGDLVNSVYIPAAASDIQNGNILHAGNDMMRGDSIAAMWPALEIIRDPYSQAGQGRVVLTWVSMWDAYMAFRSGAYKRIAFKFA